MNNEQISGNPPDFILDYEYRTVNGVGEITYTLYKEADSKGRIFYSIEISTASESALLSDITGNLNTAEYIFDLIRNGSVTPCCATEVAEDLIESIPHDMFLSQASPLSEAL